MQHDATGETLTYRFAQTRRRPILFDITANAQDAMADWISYRGMIATDCLFPSRVSTSPPITTRQYARIVDGWVKDISAIASGAHEAGSTVRYLGIEVDDALEIAEQTEI